MKRYGSQNNRHGGPEDAGRRISHWGRLRQKSLRFPLSVRLPLDGADQFSRVRNPNEAPPKERNIRNRTTDGGDDGESREPAQRVALPLIGDARRQQNPPRRNNRDRGANYVARVL